MENIVQIQYIISAFIGFGSAVIVAIIAGIFQSRIAKKNREIQEKQLEESRKQFFVQMEQSQKEYAEKIEQLQEEQRKANLKKANDKLQAEKNRFYDELIKEMAFYDSLLNELHYLNNIAHPNGKEFRIKGAYPYIDNNIRAKISLYNVALEQGADSDVLEEALKRVYDLIDPINTERFENYANAQTRLRKFEIDTAKQIIQENRKETQ